MRRRAAGATLAATVLAGCALPTLVHAPVPEGFAFPTWSTANGGAAALTEGELRAVAGCLYVVQEAGGRYLVVWPDTWRLVLDDRTPVVMDGDSEVGRDGEPVMLGGGEITPNMVPASAAPCDRTHVWGANAVLRPDRAAP